VESTRVLGTFLRDVMRRNADARNFRVFSPDENNSNRLQDLLEVTQRAWNAELVDGDDGLAPGGRVMEILSEHTCQGWLEGYLLTGRHGFFSCYEAFIHIIDSMFNQHAKWLKTTRELEWRRPIGSLNYLLTVARLAPGPQRLQPPGPGLHRPRRQQEGRRDPGLPAAGRQHAAVGR
jgi:xylulose-5-phosphate/fructose-6-phosphate phosphoketolase